MNRPKPVVLIILDGFGIAPSSRANAISLAKTPNFDKYASNYPIMPLSASGEAVGLPWGEMGNSQVGHLSLGSGLIPYQYLPRITKDIISKDFFKNEGLLKACDHAKEKNSALHIMGLVSDGGIHSYNEHLYAILELAKKENIEKVYIHAFLDGRDTIYNGALEYINKLQDKIKEIGIGSIASLAGRFYAMDRDHNWDRTSLAYNAIVNGQSKEKSSNPLQAIQNSYDNSVYDEQFMPIVITDENDNPKGTIQDNDAVIFFNFRSDRARQLTKSLIVPGFEKFEQSYYKNLLMVIMTEYEKDLPAIVAFKPLSIDVPLAKVISDAGLKQLHIAETNKYAHVTYFFNGGKETIFEGEDRILVPSPSIPSFDQKPAMSAREITSKTMQFIKEGLYDFIVINYANPDMVGHTGNIKATIEAIEILDQLVGELVDTTLSYDGVVLITAVHGLQTGIIDKEHTNNPVPLFIIGQQFTGKSVLTGVSGKDLSSITPVGVLSDVTPTILKIMGLKKPPEMTSSSLI